MHGPQLDLKREFFIAACLVSLGVICLSSSSCGSQVAPVEQQAQLEPIEVHDFGNGLVRTRAQLPEAVGSRLQVERVMPDSVRLDQPFAYRIAVQNLGQRTARGVTVLEQLADGFELVHSSIPAEPVLEEAVSRRPLELADLSEPDGFAGETVYRWRLGDLLPGEEVGFMVTVVPRRMGPLVSALAVRSDDAIESEIEVVSPALQLDLRLFDRRGVAVSHVEPGQAAILSWRVRNCGNAASDPAILSFDFPLGVRSTEQEPAGPALDIAVQPIEPGATLEGTIPLRVEDEASGMIRLSFPGGVGIEPLQREIPVGPTVLPPGPAPSMPEVPLLEQAEGVRASLVGHDRAAG